MSYTHPPSPIYIYMCVCVSNKKRYSVLLNHPNSVRCDIEKGFITCFATLIAAWSFGVSMWVYFLISSPFPYMCVCMCFSNKKRYSVLSSHPTSVRCDIKKGFITCSVTLTAACNFDIGGSPLLPTTTHYVDELCTKLCHQNFPFCYILLQSSHITGLFLNYFTFVQRSKGHIFFLFCTIFCMYCNCRDNQLVAIITIHPSP